MATTATLSAILPKFARRIGSYVGSFSTTTTVTTNNSVIATGLRDIGFTDDDVLNDSFLKFTSGNNLDTVRLISDYTGSSGTITVAGTTLTADSGTGTTFELYRYDPDQLLDSINDAANQAFPALFKRIDDRTLTGAPRQARYARPTSIEPGYVRQVFYIPRIQAKTSANNIVSTLNCDFESSTIGDDWTASSITLAAEADTTTPNNWMVFQGSQSGKCTVAASSTATLLMTVPSGTNYVGEEINVGVWVYSRTASRVSAAIRLDSGTVSVGDTHTGKGWERLTHTLVADGVSSSIKVGVSVTSGTAFVFYADEITATAGQSEVPIGYEAIILDWNEEGDNLAFLSPPPHQHNIHVVGCGALETLSSGTDTITLEPHRVNLLLDYAALTFFEGELDQSSTDDQNAILKQITHYRNKTQNGRGEMIAPSLKKNLLPAEGSGYIGMY